MKNYFVIPNSLDGCSYPTVPEAMPLAAVGTHIEKYLDGFKHQGYFSNCKREHIPLDELTFTIAPENDSHGFFGILVKGGGA